MDSWKRCNEPWRSASALSLGQAAIQDKLTETILNVIQPKIKDKEPSLLNDRLWFSFKGLINNRDKQDGSPFSKETQAKLSMPYGTIQ